VTIEAEATEVPIKPIWSKDFPLTLIFVSSMSKSAAIFFSIASLFDEILILSESTVMSILLTTYF